MAEKGKGLSLSGNSSWNATHYVGVRIVANSCGVRKISDTDLYKYNVGKNANIANREENVETTENKIMYRLFKSGGELKKSQLYRNVHGERVGIAKFNQAIENLEDAKSIAIVAGPTTVKGGRPKVVINIRD